MQSTTNPASQAKPSVDWAAVKASHTPSSFHDARTAKPRSAVVTWQTFAKQAEAQRSPFYRAIYGKSGWLQKCINLQNLSKSIAEDVAAGRQVSFEVKENGICVILFLSASSNGGYEVSSVEGKRGPWADAGVDVDLRTSAFATIVKCIAGGFDFALPDGAFDSPPAGLYVMAELCCGNTSHLTVSQKVFAFDRADTREKKVELLAALSLRVFSVGIYESPDDLLSTQAKVRPVPLAAVSRVLAHWDGRTYHSKTLQQEMRVSCVPSLYFSGAFDAQAFTDFFALHCQGEGFIQKNYDPAASEFKQWKVKAVYKNNRAMAFLSGARNSVLLLYPPGAHASCLPVGIVCAPPQSDTSGAATHGREISATMFFPRADPARSEDFKVAFEGGRWDAIEELYCIQRRALRDDPARLRPTRLLKDEYGYATLEATLCDGTRVTHDVRSSHARDYEVRVLDLTCFALPGVPVCVVKRVNQVVPDRMNASGQLQYVLDTNVFEGVLTAEHLMAGSWHEDYELLDGTRQDLTFEEKCWFRRTFWKVEDDPALPWDPQRYPAFLQKNLSVLAPGAPVERPAAVYKYYQTVCAAYRRAHSKAQLKRKALDPPPRPVPIKLPALKEPEVLALVRQCFGKQQFCVQEAFDAIAKTDHEKTTASLLRASKTRELLPQENKSLKDFFSSKRCAMQMFLSKKARGDAQATTGAKPDAKSATGAEPDAKTTTGTKPDAEYQEFVELGPGTPGFPSEDHRAAGEAYIKLKIADPTLKLCLLELSSYIRSGN